MKRILIGFLALFVFAMAAQAVDVYPTGVAATDIQAVQDAVDIGGTVILHSHTDPSLGDQVPMYFNFGNTGEDGAIEITLDVIISGEAAHEGLIPLPDLLPDQAHAPQIIDNGQATFRTANQTTIYGGAKGADDVSFQGYGVFYSFIVEEEDVNNKENYPNIQIEKIRFDSCSGFAIFMASSREYAKVDDCVFSNPRVMWNGPLPNMIVIGFSNFARVLKSEEEEDSLGAYVYLNGEISVTNCEFYMDDLISIGFAHAIRIDDLDLVDTVTVNNNLIHSKYENLPDPATSIGIYSVIKDNSKCYIGTDENGNEAPNIIYSPSGIQIGWHAMSPEPEPGQPWPNLQKYVWYNKIYNSTQSGILLHGYWHPEDNLSPNVIYKNEIIDHNGLDVYSESDYTYPSAIWIDGSRYCGVVENKISGTGSSAIALVGEDGCVENTLELNDSIYFVARDAQVYIDSADSTDNTFSNNSFGPLSKVPKANAARILVKGNDNTFSANKHYGPIQTWEEGHGIWLMGPHSSGNVVECPEIFGTKKNGSTILPAEYENYWKDQNSPANTFSLNCN